MSLSRDEMEALVNTHYDDEVYETPDQRSFAMLVELASLTYNQYLESSVPNDEDPDSFKPDTLGGVSYGWALIEGLIENLEMRHPDGNFRDPAIFKPNPCGHWLGSDGHCTEMPCWNYTGKFTDDNNTDNTD